MKAGQITAKLRDAVPVEFYQDDSEKAQYKNIDIPDSLKELEITDFKFITPENGKISFRLYFAPGILPAEFPPVREKMTRAEKAAAKAAEEPASADEIPEQPVHIETRFNVTGDRRKALVAAMSAYLNQQAEYLGAPSFVYAIGSYRVDKTGALTGDLNPELLAALAEQGFILEETATT